MLIYTVMGKTERGRELDFVNSHLFISKMVWGDFFRKTLLSQGTICLERLVEIGYVYVPCFYFRV